MPKIAVAFCCDAPARYQMGYRRCSPLVCMATAFALVVHTATAQLSRGSSGFGSNSGIGLGTKSGGILGNLGSGFGSLESTLGSFGAGGAPVIGTTFGSLRQPVAPALGSLPSNGMLGQEIKQLPGALDASSLPLGSAFGSLHLPPRPTQNACGGITAAGSPEAVDLSGVAKLSSERPPTAPGPLPSGLQFGNSLSGALGSSMRDSSRPNINELQNQAVDNPQVDALCPGKVRTSTDVGADCWKKIWISGGCREENVPKYEQWHQVQSLEVLVADVVQWSNLPDDLHRQGCYGSVGPPPQQPTPSIQNFGVAASSPQDTIPSGHFARAAASEDELAQLIQNAGRRPIFLEMWTKSCGFCNIMFPVFEMLAEKYRGRAYFRTVDVERIPEIVSAFRVNGLPTFKAILNGQLAQEMDGADAGGLEKMIVSTVHTADLNDVHLSSDDLLAFLRRHNLEDDISPEQVEVMLQSRVDDIPKFLQELEETYSATPRTSGGFIAEGVQSMVASCSRRAHVRDLSDSELLAEIRDLQNEVNRREFQKAESTTNPCKLSRSSSSVDPDTHVERLVVLGGGPAGLAAALYGARAGLCPLLVSPLVGGQLMAKGVNVENYPGIVQSRGSAIIQDMRAQAAGFFVEQLETIVLSVDLSKRPFFLKLNSSKVPSIRAESLIVATGSESRWLGVKGESELRGVGVSSCAACDGPLYRGKNCVVVGGGDAAMEEALLLARLCDSVTLIHRRNHFRAAPILSNRVLQHPSIKIRWSSEVEEFQSEDVGKGNVLAQLLVRNVISGELSQIPADGAFVAIGHDPNTKIFEGQLSIDIFTGHIETFDRSTRSSVDGVFVAGDVADPTYRQAITSAASGAAAAIDAERWLSSNGDVEIRHELNLGTLNSCHSHPCDNNGEELVQPVFDEPHGIFDQPAQFADASHAITDILPGEQEISVESLNASDPHEFQGNLQTLSNHSTNISESLSLDQETLSPVHEFADIVLDVEDEQKEQFGMAPDVKTSDSIKLPISDEAQHAHGRLEDGLHASQLELQDQPSDLRISDNVSNTSDGCNATLDAKETLGDEPTLARLETTQQVESSLREMMHEQLEFGEDVFSSNLSEPNARRDVEVTQDMHARSVVNESSEVQGSQDVQNTTAELSNIPLEDMEQIGEVGARSTSSVNDNVTTPSSNRTETMGKKDDKAENDISVDKHDDEKSAESLNELLKVRPQIIESDKTAQGTKAVRDVNVESSTTKKSQKKGKRKRRKSESR